MEYSSTFLVIFVKNQRFSRFSVEKFADMRYTRREPPSVGGASGRGRTMMDMEVVVMGKRFLLSLALILIFVVLVALGAGVLFSGDYQQLKALEAQSSSTPTPELFGVTSGAPAEDAAASTPAAETADPAESASEPYTELLPVDSSAVTAAVLLSQLTLEEKICQLLFVTPEALTGYSAVTQSGSATQEAINSYPVGGIVYFSANLVTAEQTAEMISNTQSYARARTGVGLFIGVDEEGGSVARLADNLGTTAFEDMAVYGAQGDTSVAYEIGATLAADLRSMGFNVDFAPVADVLTNDDNQVVRYRSFGSDPELVSAMVSSEVQGLLDGGVLCAPKHFPGHGSTGGDTHDGFAATDRTMEELEECDLKPFRAAILAGAPMIMVGHMTMTALDSENPASLSNAIVTGLLREQLGYDGIIITDALNMGAITDLCSSGEAAVRALEAGCDMLLCVPSVETAVNAITAAVEEGRLTEERIDESVRRILTAKVQYGIAS